MTTLTGSSVASRYKDLLQVSNSNSGIDGTLRAVSDGEGTASLLELSSTAVNISSGFQLGSVAVTSTATELNYLSGQDQAVDSGSSPTFAGITSSGFYVHSVTSGITASTTQTQGQGALTKEINEVSVCANANDTVTLISAVTGYKQTVINNGVQTLQIFPASGDDAGAGVDTAVTLASGSNVTYTAIDTTNWEAI